jgi:hypothetical protein
MTRRDDAMTRRDGTTTRSDDATTNASGRLRRALRFGRRAAAAWVLVGAGLTAAAPASADGASCREWSAEHQAWKAETVRRYLEAAPREVLDTAVFELLQREAFLTSCDLPVSRAREAFVGWRLVGLAPDEYGRAVVQSLLAESGLTLDVRSWFGPLVSQARPSSDDWADAGR